MSNTEKTYCVYIHISPSNKRYIGITSQEPKRRWRKGNAYKHNSYFTRAIEKYGWDNFQHIVITKGLSKEQAEWLEIELIKVWDSTNKDKGYNILKGGDIIDNPLSGENHHNYGIPMSEEQRNKISETRIKNGVAKGENNPMFGKHHSEETINKISETKNNKTEEEKNIINKKISEARIKNGVAKGKNNPSAKAVINLTTMKVFDTMKEGAEFYNCSDSGISQCCSGKKKSCGKLEDGTPLVWMKYVDYLENNNNNNNIA